MKNVSEHIVFKKLEWDTEQLCIGCGLIDCSLDVDDQRKIFSRIDNLIKKNSEEISFITIRLACTFTSVLNRLLKGTTDFIDTELIYIFKGVQQKQSSDVNFVKTHNPDVFLSLAEEMRWSRLFLDKRISPENALALWKKSISNHCVGRSDELAIAFVDGKPAGLVTIHFENERTIRLFIVGVLPQFQKRGVGTELLVSITKRYGKQYDIFVETSSMNVAAQRLYQKVGFSLNNMRYILHYMDR